jgi:hypothetical protein
MAKRLGIFGGDTVADINTAALQAYVAKRSKQPAVRPELEDLRAASGGTAGLTAATRVAPVARTHADLRSSARLTPGPMSHK